MKKMKNWRICNEVQSIGTHSQLCGKSKEETKNKVEKEKMEEERNEGWMSVNMEVG